MAKTGPRPKPRAERRSKVVSVLFTPAEFKRIRTAAGHQTVSSYIRERILAVPFEAATPAEIEALRGQVQTMLARLDEVSKASAEKKRT